MSSIVESPEKARGDLEAREIEEAEEVDPEREAFQTLRGEVGGVVIEAPAEAAETLGALFEGMAAMPRASAPPSE